MTHAVSGVYGVRYQVKDVGRSIEFYTQKLGFTLDRKALARFRSGLGRRFQIDPEWARCIGLASDA